MANLTLKVNCVAAIFISERLVLSKSWTSNARHVGDQSLITALITLLIAVLEIKVSKKAKKKVGDFARVHRLNKSSPRSDSFFRRRDEKATGDFVYFSACV
jgi:hypothetical protein